MVAVENMGKNREGHQWPVAMYPRCNSAERKKRRAGAVGAIAIAREYGARPVVDDLNVFNLPYVPNTTHMQHVIDGPIDRNC